ncbi:MAG: aspartate/tyrosine/aromatic aminotransferase [Salaquimonas sp.]|nr:aspartate/tyrosine/aromatic aminotransferase [Salaquimonas sp.]
MFSALQPIPPDPILSITAKFRADSRQDKFDLGVGVYRDEEGNTPIPAAVKEAERRVIAEQTTKTYLSPVGNPAFNDAMAKLVLGDGLDTERTSAVQTPGGTGAVRLLLDLVKLANPDATIWISDPTWPNHKPMAGAANLKIAAYPYYDAASGILTHDAMMAALDGLKAGDAVILHGCCHNPSGADLSLAQWNEIAALLNAKGALPLVDFAYQGLGNGLEEDATGLRLLADQCPEMMIAASCSKNFGLYRDRVGAAIVIAANAAEKQITLANAAIVARCTYSMPPDEGAAIVARILNDEALRASWTAELESMRLRINDLRSQLAAELRLKTNSERFDFLAGQKGMFSLLGTGKEAAEALTRDHAVYLPASGRINIAGLRTSGIETVASAIAATSR